MSQVEIYSAQVCPYAHRTRLALREKGVDFELIEIDVHNRPDWFYDISPYGRVPVLKHGDTHIFESSVINEYIDEVFPDPPLMPKAPADRAKARIWIDFCNTQFTSAFYRLLKADDAAARAEYSDTLLERLHFIDEEGLATGEGPYWFGEQLTLTDIAFYPFFERFAVLEHFTGITLPDNCSRIHRWFSAMGARDAVKALMNTPEFYIERYRDYGKPTSEQEVSACPIPSKPQ